MNLYSLRTAPGGFTITKFDADLNPLATYTLSPKGHSYSCDCPAGLRSVKLKPCKHQRMVPIMASSADTGAFYNPDTKEWAGAIVEEEPAANAEIEAAKSIPPAVEVDEQSPLDIGTDLHKKIEPPGWQEPVLSGAKDIGVPAEPHDIPGLAYDKNDIEVAADQAIEGFGEEDNELITEEEITSLPDGVERDNHLLAGEGAGQSPLAADIFSPPSVKLPEQASALPVIKRRI